MVKLLKFFGYILFFLFVLVYFLPKESLYYYAEQELQKQQVVFSDEEIVAKTLSLELQDAKLFYQSIETAKIATMDIKLLVFYNLISLHDIVISSVASSFIPLKIESVQIKQTILNPLNVLIEAKGEFGEVRGVLHILDRNISIILEPSSIMKQSYNSTLREFHKNEKGEYQYDQTF